MLPQLTWSGDFLTSDESAELISVGVLAASTSMRCDRQCLCGQARILYTVVCSLSTRPRYGLMLWLRVQLGVFNSKIFATLGAFNSSGNKTTFRLYVSAFMAGGLWAQRWRWIRRDWRWNEIGLLEFGWGEEKSALLLEALENLGGWIKSFSMRRLIWVWWLSWELCRNLEVQR